MWKGGRKYYYNSGPRFEFEDYNEKREFKRRVRLTLKTQLGYTTERQFLEDVYKMLATGDAAKLIEFLQKRMELYRGVGNGA